MEDTKQTENRPHKPVASSSPAFENAPRPEDYTTLQEWNDAYWDWAKRDMHRYIDETWDDIFKRAWKNDPVLSKLWLIVPMLVAVLVAVLFSIFYIK